MILQRTRPAFVRWRLPIVWREIARASRVPSMMAYRNEHWGECARLAKIDLADALAARRSSLALRIAKNGAICTIMLGDTDGPQGWLDEVDAIPVSPGFVEHLKDDLVITVLTDQGALHSVISIRQRAIARTHRLGMTMLHAEHLSELASALSEMGDFQGAIEVARGALDRDAHPENTACDEASMHINLAWALIRLAERTGDTYSQEAERELKSAVAILEERADECSKQALATARLNLAWSALLGGDLQAASLQLAKAATLAGAAGADFLGESQMLRARLSLAMGDIVAARAALDRLRSGHKRSPDLEVDIVLTRAEVSEAEGDTITARSLYEDGHRRILARLGAVAHEQNAQRFVYDRHRAWRSLVRLLHGAGDLDGAFRVARQAASAEWRLLATRSALARTHGMSERRMYLEQRAQSESIAFERWDLSEMERTALASKSILDAARREGTVLGDGLVVDLAALPMRVPEPGEVLLLYLPAKEGLWLGFAATTTGVMASLIDARGLPPPSATADAAMLEIWSSRLLAPFERAIGGSERVRVLPSFGVQAIPFHALPWKSRPLLAHGSVEYSLDLPAAASSREIAARSALVVGDTQGDLEGARKESEEVTARLRKRGLATDVLIGRGADGPSVRARLPQADHFHYAGHSESSGHFGWRGHLRLGQGTELSISDIVALDRVPGTVVLLSCDGGVVRGEPREQRIALATAFLFAGSHAVLAATIHLPAAEAPKIAAALYETSAPEALSGFDLGAAYRSAMLGPLATAVSTSTWQSLRMWTW